MSQETNDTLIVTGAAHAFTLSPVNSAPLKKETVFPHFRYSQQRLGFFFLI